MRAYVKQAGESLELQNSCAEIKIRAERRIGEFSKELPKAQLKGSKNVSSTHDGETTKSEILKDAGIKHHERYEAIANIPEEELEKILKPKAKENIRATQKNKSSTAFQKSDKQIDTLKQTAKAIGTSHDTLHKVETIVKEVRYYLALYNKQN